VGTEDYPFLEDGSLARNNAELVTEVARVARENGREIASPDEARRMIGMARKLATHS